MTVQGFGVVEFPDTMTPQQVQAAIERDIMPMVKERRAKTAAMVENDPITQGAKNFNQDSGFFSNLAAGAGKAISDVGLGVRQITGNASHQEVDEAAQRDKALMNTAGGVVGNVGTQVGMALAPGGAVIRAGNALRAPAVQAAGRYALSSPATMGGAVTQGSMGATQAALQPVATGESRSTNAAIGGAAGAAVPVAGMALRAGRAAVEPMYQGGQERIVGRAIRNAAGQDADAVVQALSQAQPLVPGSLPTAGQAAGNAGVAALERTAFATVPEVTNPVQQRLAQQNSARVDALRGMAGTSGAREAAEQARDTTANQLYGAARQAGIDPEMAQILQPQIKNLTERMPAGVMERARELARINGEVMDAAGSLNGLHWVKIAVDDLLSAAPQTGMGAQTRRGLTQFKSDLLTVMDDLSPAYGNARQTFAQMNGPINQMDVASDIAQRSIRPLDDQLLPGAYARALADPNLPARATGFSGATLENTMSPGQLAILEALRGDLQRANFAQTAGRGVGSDTVQKLAYSNIIDNAGIPTWLRNMGAAQAVGGFAARGADAVYGRANREIAGRLANALLEPSEAARMMQSAVPSDTAARIARALMTTLPPAAIGGATTYLNAP